MLLWEGTVVFAVVFAPRIAIGFRLVEGGLAAAVIGLLAMSARLFPSPELPRPWQVRGWPCQRKLLDRGEQSCLFKQLAPTQSAGASECGAMAGQ